MTPPSLAGFLALLLVLITVFFLLRIERKLKNLVQDGPPDSSFFLLQQQMQGLQCQMAQSGHAAKNRLDRQRLIRWVPGSNHA